jgi:predicted transcriptional regulator
MKAFDYDLRRLGATSRPRAQLPGMSQEAVADAAGLSRHAVLRAESGTDCPLVSTVAAIVRRDGGGPRGRAAAGG